MANFAQNAGASTRGLFDRMMGVVGPLSSVAIAFFVYAIFWESAVVRYVPDLSSIESAMKEIFIAGVVALGYLVIQMLALVTRHTGRVWAEVGDLFFSLIPLIVLMVALTDHWPISELMMYEYSIAVFFGMAAVADVFVVTLSAFKLLLMANDMFVVSN